MQNKIYDEEEFQKAFAYIDKNPFTAKKMLSDYIKKYPTDYYSIAYYISLLERLNQFAEAKHIFREVDAITKNDYSFMQNKARYKGFQCVMALNKVKILASDGKFKELLDYYEKNQVLFENRRDTEYLLYYSKAKLGLIDETTIKLGPYRFLQAVNYSEKRFKENLLRHTATNYGYYERPDYRIFTSDFPIDTVINEVKKHIPSDNKICPGLYDDVYYFKYDNCGTVNGEVTNYFKVVCFQNTNELIKMYPANDGDNIPKEDLNYIQYQVVDSKVKRLSQIEKFNRRFNR